MNILVTAGNTQSPIDRVRCITNIFTGRTGAKIAAYLYGAGHTIRLITSHPKTVEEISFQRLRSDSDFTVIPYRTFDDLETAMASTFREVAFDAVIHAAAVNDYHVVGTYARLGDEMVDVSAGKVKSDHPELWMKLERAPKLVDKIRSVWGFRGYLVKFKLEVGISDEELLKIAERSRQSSQADCMVANTLEGSQAYAFIGAGSDYRRIDRDEIAKTILELLQK